jgi:hypothetical protein
MVTLAYFAPFPADAQTHPGPSLLRRIYDAIIESQQRRAHRDIERLVANRAGVFNDALEMEIGQRVLPGSWTRSR